MILFLRKKGFDTMNEQEPRAIFGLNFLQDMKGDSHEITGAYDPEQELWITQGQVQLDEEALANVKGGGLPLGRLMPDAGSLLGKTDLPKRDLPAPWRTTTKTTHETTAYRTNGGNDWNEDSNHDTERD
jgi:hypothetical protein